MRGVAQIVAGCVALSALSRHALAERPAKPDGAQPYVHDGAYLRVAAGVGLFRATTRTKSVAGTERSFAGTTLATELSVGGSPTRGLAFGGSFWMDPVFGLSGERSDGSSIQLDETHFRLAALGPFLDLYPTPENGLHFQTLLAYGRINVSYADLTRQDVSQDADGLVFGIGVGYELWLGPELSAGVLARVAWAPLDANANGQSFGSNANAISVEAFSPALMITATHH